MEKTQPFTPKPVINKNRPWYKKVIYIVPLTLLAYFSILWLVTREKPTPREVVYIIDQTAGQEPVVSQEKVEEGFKERLNYANKIVAKKLDISLYPGSVEKVESALEYFEGYGNMVRASQESNDPEIKALGQRLEKLIVNEQVRVLPLLRKNYGMVAANKLWEHDVSISVGGSKNTVINITGGIFAANENKSQVQEMIGGILTKLRFKQARYRWYEDEDKYTYFDLVSQKDSQLY